MRSPLEPKLVFKEKGIAGEHDKNTGKTFADDERCHPDALFSVAWAKPASSIEECRTISDRDIQFAEVECRSFVLLDCHRCLRHRHLPISAQRNCRQRGGLHHRVSGE